MCVFVRFYVDTDVGEKKDNNKMETEKKRVSEM